MSFVIVESDEDYTECIHKPSKKRRYCFEHKEAVCSDCLEDFHKNCPKKSKVTIKK
jgi:hypothetical protein